MGSYLDKLLLGIRSIWHNDVEVTPPRPTVNFIGGTVVDNPGLGTTDVTLGGGSSGGGIMTIQDSGSTLPFEPILNFIGATVADDPGNTRTTVTVTGGGGGVSVLNADGAIPSDHSPYSTLDFFGNVGAIDNAGNVKILAPYQVYFPLMMASQLSAWTLVGPSGGAAVAYTFPDVFSFFSLLPAALNGLSLNLTLGLIATSTVATSFSLFGNGGSATITGSTTTLSTTGTWQLLFSDALSIGTAADQWPGPGGQRVDLLLAAIAGVDTIKVQSAFLAGNYI